MNVEMTLVEAELLIATLKYAEDESTWGRHDAMSRAIADLWHWRSALLETYLKARLAQPKSDPAVPSRDE